MNKQIVEVILKELLQNNQDFTQFFEMKEKDRNELSEIFSKQIGEIKQINTINCLNIKSLITHLANNENNTQNKYFLSKLITDIESKEISFYINNYNTEILDNFYLFCNKFSKNQFDFLFEYYQENLNIHQLVFLYKMNPNIKYFLKILSNNHLNQDEWELIYVLPTTDTFKYIFSHWDKLDETILNNWKHIMEMTENFYYNYFTLLMSMLESFETSVSLIDYVFELLIDNDFFANITFIPERKYVIQIFGLYKDKLSVEQLKILYEWFPNTQIFLEIFNKSEHLDDKEILSLLSLAYPEIKREVLENCYLKFSHPVLIKLWIDIRSKLSIFQKQKILTNLISLPNFDEQILNHQQLLEDNLVLNFYFQTIDNIASLNDNFIQLNSCSNSRYYLIRNFESRFIELLNKSFAIDSETITALKYILEYKGDIIYTIKRIYGLQKLYNAFEAKIILDETSAKTSKQLLRILKYKKENFFPFWIKNYKEFF